MSQIRRPSTRWAIFLRNMNGGHLHCAYCGRRLHSVKDAEIDHIKPQAKNGGNSPTNLVVSCPTCNRAKSDNPVGTFIAELAAEQAAYLAPFVAPSGSDELDVACIASEIEASLITEITARVRRERRRELNRKAGRAHARLSAAVSGKAA